MSGAMRSFPDLRIELQPENQLDATRTSDASAGLNALLDRGSGSIARKNSVGT